MSPQPHRTEAPSTGRRRAGPDTAAADTRTLVLDAVRTPVRAARTWSTVLVALVVAAETAGLVTRRTCGGGSCGSTAAAWATRLDMDALGSVPRLLITLLLAATAVVCGHGVLRAGRHGAGVWWTVLGAGCALLAAAKHWSLHSVVEVRLGGLLPGADVQSLFVAVSVVGLAVVLVSGRWVRRDTRTSVATWLALYAVAAVGLAAVTVILAPLGAGVADLSTFIEETGEGLAAVGLLVTTRAAAATTARRRPIPRAGEAGQALPG